MGLNIFNNVSRSPPHEHQHKPSKIEFGLAIIITVALTASLSSEQFIEIPRYVTPLLIICFVGLKIYHILKRGGTLIEDYAAIGVIAIFLVLYFILGGRLNALLIVVFVFILFYSAGLMLWVKSTFGSKKVTHFIASYVITILMIILLFTGAYLSREESFLQQGVKSPLNFEDALYFSTVTVTTVGYGDIVPLGINRALAGLEALLGMIINVALLGYVLSYGRSQDNEN